MRRPLFSIRLAAACSLKRAIVSILRSRHDEALEILTLFGPIGEPGTVVASDEWRAKAHVSKPRLTQTVRRGKVLVMGDDVRSLLSVIRSLGRGGVEVHMTWHPKDSEALHSRYLTKAHHLPLFDSEDDHWKEALIGLMKREQFDLVIPCSDPTLIPLQTHRYDLEPFGKIYLLEDDVSPWFPTNSAQTSLARSAGVHMPREWVVNNLEEAESLLMELQLPVVLKPEFSFDPKVVGPRRKVRKLYSWVDYLRLVKIMLGGGPVAVQENFIGDGVGVELFLSAGNPLMCFQHRRLHEPMHGGGSSYRQSVPVDPALLEASWPYFGRCAIRAWPWWNSK